MTPDWCLTQYMAQLEGLRISSTLEELCGHALLPAEHSKDSCEGAEPQEQALHKPMELTGRMTELVLSPGALDTAITRFKANTCIFLITSIMQAKEVTAACLHLNLVESCPHWKVRSQVSSAGALLDESCWCCEGRVTSVPHQSTNLVFRTSGGLLRAGAAGPSNSGTEKQGMPAVLQINPLMLLPPKIIKLNCKYF